MCYYFSETIKTFIFRRRGSVICLQLGPEIYLKKFKALPNWDLTIEQWRRPWKRRWKIGSASFQTVSRLSQVTQLLKRRELMLELTRGGHARVQTERVEFIASLFPSSKKLKFGHFTSSSCWDGKERYKKAWCTYRVVVLRTKPRAIIPLWLLTKPIAFWRRNFPGPGGQCISVIYPRPTENSLRSCDPKSIARAEEWGLGTRQLKGLQRWSHLNSIYHCQESQCSYSSHEAYWSS